MAGLSVGTLDREVTIQHLVTPEADSGYPTETWEDLVDVWMAKVDARGAERFRASQLSAPYDTRWRMHWIDEMDPDVVDVPKRRRLVYRGRIFDITAAMEMGWQDGIELYTLAKPSDEDA